VSVLQTVLERINLVSFPHGPKHHVAIEFRDGSTCELTADLVAACRSLDEARALTDECRDWQVLEDANGSVDYFPRTTWVQP
jgi:hypothetical protein